MEERKWTTWPTSKPGKASTYLIGASLLVWLALPIMVQVMNRYDFERVVGATFVIAFLALSVIGAILSWYSFAVKKDKSKILLIAACLMSGILVLTAVGEVIEGFMMSGNGG